MDIAHVLLKSMWPNVIDNFLVLAQAYLTSTQQAVYKPDDFGPDGSRKGDKLPCQTYFLDGVPAVDYDFRDPDQNLMSKLLPAIETARASESARLEEEKRTELDASRLTLKRGIIQAVGAGTQNFAGLNNEVCELFGKILTSELDRKKE
jgi:hypothetical protein